MILPTRSYNHNNQNNPNNISTSSVNNFQGIFSPSFGEDQRVFGFYSPSSNNPANRPSPYDNKYPYISPQAVNYPSSINNSNS